MAAHGPNVRRRQLGRKMRQLRLDAKVSLDNAAKYVGVTRQTIGRIENGKQAILPRNVRLMCLAYDIGAPLVDTLMRLAEDSNEQGWWASYSDIVPDWFEDFIGLEGDAEEIRSYEAQAVPGLLQIPEYVRAISEAARPRSSGEEIDRLVRVRGQRQDKLRTEDGVQIGVVLDESALRRPVGTPEEFRRQVEHLIAMSKSRHINIRVLPFAVGGHAAMTGSFTMLRFPDELEMNLVYLEHDHGSMYLERPSDLDRYATMFEQLRKQALSARETAKWLANLVTQM